MSPQSCENPFEIDRLNEAGNFRPEWDVTSIGKEISDGLDRDLDAIRTSAKPDPARKIHVVVGSVGYGKTHQFGRVFYRQGERVLCVSVPPGGDPGRTILNIQWYLVETLFQPGTAGVSPLQHALSRLLQDSVGSGSAPGPVVRG